MKIYLKVCLAAVLVFFSSGCFDFNIYESGVPLAPVKKAVFDPQLVGEWESMETEDRNAEPYHLRFIRFNQKEYVIASGQGNGCDLSRAYIVRIKGMHFINLQELASDGEKHFAFCTYSLSPDGVLILTFVGNELFEASEDGFSSSKKLYQFIKKNLTHDKLFNTEAVMKFRRR